MVSCPRSSSKLGTEPRLQPGFPGVGFGHFPLASPRLAPRAAPATKAGWARLLSLAQCPAQGARRRGRGGWKPRNWSSSSAAPHPALSWARSETSLSTWAVRRAPALGRGGYGGAGGSPDLAWASGLALAARILSPSRQPCPLRVLDVGRMGQGEGLCDLDLGFPIWKGQHLVRWEMLLRRGFRARCGCHPAPQPCPGVPHTVRPVSEWPGGDSSGGLCV